MKQKFDYSVLRNKIFEIIDQKKIISIYIIGSGARNELTFLKDENGIQLSDLEMVVVMKSPFQAFKDQKLYKFYYNSEILCEFIKTHKLFFSKSRSPLIYNFKINGLKIYGPEIRDSIKIQKSCETHPFEAVKLVYHRIIPFLAELANYDFEKSKKLVYSLCKVYIAIAEANSILQNEYSCSYQDLLTNLIKIGKKSKKDSITINALKLKLNKITFKEFKVPKISQIFEDLYNFLSINKDILIKFKPGLIERIFIFLNEHGIKNRFKSLFKIPIIQLYLKVFSFISKCNQDEEFFIMNIKTTSTFSEDWNKVKKIEAKF